MFHCLIHDTLKRVLFIHQVQKHPCPATIYNYDVDGNDMYCVQLNDKYHITDDLLFISDDWKHPLYNILCVCLSLMQLMLEGTSGCCCRKSSKHGRVENLIYLPPSVTILMFSVLPSLPMEGRTNFKLFFTTSSKPIVDFCFLNFCFAHWFLLLQLVGWMSL